MKNHAFGLRKRFLGAISENSFRGPNEKPAPPYGKIGDPNPQRGGVIAECGFKPLAIGKSVAVSGLKQAIMNRGGL
jgi:hypothetical protein